MKTLNRDKARQATLKLNSQMKTYQQNKKAGLKHSIDYLRWLIALKNEVNLLWSQC